MDAIQRNLKQHNLVSPLPDSVHLLGNFFIPMKEIQLTQGKVALVDDEDYDFLMQWKWHVIKPNRNNYYVRRVVYYGKKRTSILMHREIIKCDGFIIDHISGNGLDNQKCNLRICKTEQNVLNRRKNINNLSGYKGVSWFKTHKKWRAQIQYKKIVYHLGVFEKRIDAAKAYNNAAQKYHGEFANLNKID